MEGLKYPESAIEAEIVLLETELNSSFREAKKMLAEARAHAGRKPELDPRVPALLGNLQELLGEDEPELQELAAEISK